MMMDELKRPPLVEEGAGGDDAEIDALPEFDGGRRERVLFDGADSSPNVWFGMDRGTGTQ